MNYPQNGFPQQGYPQQGYPQQGGFPQPQQYPQQGQQLMPQQQAQNPMAPQQGGPIALQNIQLPSIFKNVELGSEMSDNVSGGFAVVSIKGKVFRIKFGGNETPLTANFQGAQVAAPFFDVIIPRASDKLAKTYYEGGYTEGSDDSPRCASEDGIAPNTPNPIAPQCALCPMNAFGSKINEMTGKRGKACADTRKIVIVPANNVENEAFGGPMLLRVPAASLGALADYDKQLRGMGIPYYAVVTRISFDQTVAYPKLVFTPVAGLDEPTAAKIAAYRADIGVNDILFGAPVTTTPALPAGGGVQQMPVQQVAPQGLPVAQPQVQQPQFQQAVMPQQQFQQPVTGMQPQQQFPGQAFPGAVPGYDAAYQQQAQAPQQFQQPMGGTQQQTQFSGQQQAFQQAPQTVAGFDPMAQGGVQQPVAQQEPPAATPAAPKRRGRGAAAAAQQQAPQQQAPAQQQAIPQLMPQQGFPPQVQAHQPQQTGFAPPAQPQGAPGGLLGKLDALLGPQGG